MDAQGLAAAPPAVDDDRPAHCAELAVCHDMTPIASATALPAVRLWRVALEAEGSDGRLDDAWLSASERQRADAFVFRVDAERYRASHRALRQLLHRHGRWPHRAEFALGCHGKPTLGPGHASFNLSHSGAWALIGLAHDASTAGIGVDIEEWRPIDDVWQVAEEVFTPDEQAALRAMPADRLVHGFLRCWTRKEACLKALGSGLSIAPRTFCAGVAPQACDVTLRTDGGRVDVRVESVDAGDGLLAAVALTIGPHDAALERSASGERQRA